jgi:hypothetical protein
MARQLQLGGAVLRSVGRLEDFTGGWLVGNFRPRIFQSDDLEVGLKRFKKGDREAEHFQRVATEITIVIFGEICLGVSRYREGDIVEIPPMESAGFEALSDCCLLVIKRPSIPDDKVEGNSSCESLST